jgi:hypothetical protein
LLTFLLLAIPPLLAGSALGGWLVYADIDRTLVEKFEGRRWDFPSKIYADGFAIFPGLYVERPSFYGRLARLGLSRGPRAPESPRRVPPHEAAARASRSTSTHFDTPTTTSRAA